MNLNLPSSPIPDSVSITGPLPANPRTTRIAPHTHPQNVHYPHLSFTLCTVPQKSVIQFT